MKGSADGGHGVDVLHFLLGSQFLLSVGPQGNIHIAPHLALFHVRVGNIPVIQNLLEGLEIGVGFFRGVYVRLGNDFHQGGPRAVVVDQGIIGVMGNLRRVFFQMDASQLHGAERGDAGFDYVIRIGPGVQGHFPAQAQRKIQLGGLVIFSHVRIEIILAVPLGNLRAGTSQHQAGQQRAFNGEFIQDGQGARQPQAGGAHTRIGFKAKAGFAGAEHFALCLDLAVDFQANGHDVI